MLLNKPHGQKLRLLAAAVCLAVGILAPLGIGGREQITRWLSARQTLQLGGRIVLPKLSELVVLDLASRQETVLSRYGMSEAVSAASWSPDRNTIAFAFYHRHPGDSVSSGEIMAMAADGSGMRTIAERERPGDVFDGPVWTRDGQALYFAAFGLAQGRPFQRIERIGANGNDRSIFLDNALAPALSPDGRELVYIREERGVPGLWVMNLATGEARSIIPTGQFQVLAGPRFSPDGRQIAVAISDPGLAGSRPAGPFGWLLAPTALAHGDPWDVWTVSTGGGEPRRLTDVRVDEMFPMWAPDGGHLAMWSSSGLYVVPAGGGKVVQVLSAGGFGAPDWAE